VAFPHSFLGLSTEVFRKGHQERMLMFEEVRGKNFNKGTLKSRNKCGDRKKNFALKT